MERIVGCCGIICSECPTFKATQINDDAERSRVADLWTKEYGTELTVKDINCLSCLSKGSPVFHHCNVCKIRKCVFKRKIDNCAYCEEYPCEQLTTFFEAVNSAKNVLDEIHVFIKKREQ
jgi:hypothetical protein